MLRRRSHYLTSSESEIVDQHVPCDIPQSDGEVGCGSSDGMCTYDDGHKFCFACEGHQQGDNPKVLKPNHAPCFTPLKKSFSLPLTERGITVETMRKFDYGQGRDRAGAWVHITSLRDAEGKIVGQKVRDREKNFFTSGTVPTTFWGQHLFDKGKKLVITEGEIDAMSVSQVFGNRYPVVSLPQGGGSAKKTVKANLPWLAGFEEIILCFDEDEVGAKAARIAAKLLPPGKAKIAKLPLKDASLMLQKGQGEELKRAIYDAKVWRPDTIVSGDGLLSELQREIAGDSVTLPHPGLQEMLKGHRAGEILTVGAGSGVGKSTLIKELMGQYIREGDKVGGFFLEEPVRRTVQGVLTTFCNFPVHLRMVDGWAALPKKEQEIISEKMGQWVQPNLELFDNTVISPDDLLTHMRYMATSLGCRTLVLDHITMLANLAQEGQERSLLDNTMNRIASLVEELEVRLLLISHLKRPQGTPHEEGGQVRTGDFRGSTQIACLSHNIVGVERNQQHPTNRDFTRIRVLKCRLTGATGVAGWMQYDPLTGRMTPCDEPPGGLDKVVEGGDSPMDSGEEY